MGTPKRCAEDTPLVDLVSRTESGTEARTSSRTSSRTHLRPVPLSAVRNEVRQLRLFLYTHVFSDYSSQRRMSREVSIPESSFYKQAEGHAEPSGVLLFAGLSTLPAKRQREWIQRLLPNVFDEDESR